MSWIKLLAYITGSVDQELLLRNEYLVAENRILRSQITGRVQLNDGERKTLAEIGKKLGRKALAEVAHIVRPETILGWNKRLIAKKFDGSKKRRHPGSMWSKNLSPFLEGLARGEFQLTSFKFAMIKERPPKMNIPAVSNSFSSTGVKDFMLPPGGNT